MSALPVFISAAVPLTIWEMQRSGGPTDADRADAKNFVGDLCTHGDTLLYGGNPGQAAELANRLAYAIAVISFAPGGITIFGQHFEGRPIESATHSCYDVGSGMNEA